MDEQDTEEVDCQALLRQCRPVLQYSCFTDKSVRYSEPVGRRWMLQNCTGILHRVTVQGAGSLCHSMVLETCSAHPVFSVNIYPSQVSDVVED